MKLDNPYSPDLFAEAYGSVKYWNHSPWDVAMSKSISEEFNYFKAQFQQDFRNEKKDCLQYLVLLKIILDRPMLGAKNIFEN